MLKQNTRKLKKILFKNFILTCLCAVQLTRALEEDEFAIEHQLAYRLDQVNSAMASSDGVANAYA